MAVSSDAIRRLENEAFERVPDNNVLYNDVFGFLNIAAAGKKIPGWWTIARDKALRRFYRESDHLSGATHAMVAKMVAVPLSIRPKNPHITSHTRLAQQYHDNLMIQSGVMNGWAAEYSKFILDYITQDNGSFFGIMAPGDKSDEIPSGERPSGVIHLDAGECTRTGSYLYPVWYTHPRTSKTYKMHRSRVMFMSSMPAAEERAYGVGFCAISRAFDSAQTLMDIARYKQEKLGSRPLRAIMTVNGMDYAAVKEMIKDWRIEMNAAGLKRFAHMLLLAQMQGNLKVDITELSGIPDGFNEMDSTTLAMYTIALAMGVDVRELWPATQTASRDAETQHIKARAKTPGLIMSSVEHMLNTFYLPPTLYAKFDYTDDYLDKLTADIRWLRGRTRKVELDSGAMNTRAVRVNALRSGDINQDTFELMELHDYRLPDSGDPVELIYWSTDPDIQRYLAIGDVDVVNPPTSDVAIDSLINRIDAQTAVNNALLINGSSERQRSKLRQANAALKWLRNKVNPNTQVEITIDSVNLTNNDRDNEIEATTSPSEVNPEMVSINNASEDNINVNQ